MSIIKKIWRKIVSPVILNLEKYLDSLPTSRYRKIKKISA
jgi:hypothetical protein